ncbi:MAG: type II secretion system F family protein, partial [Planctomycetota bacterium]
FDLDLPVITQLLIAMSDYVVVFFWLPPLIGLAFFIIVKLICKFRHGRMGYDQFIIKIPIFGGLVEKNILARTTRTLGTLVSSGVPILEALTITRETANNAMFERMFSRVTDAIREGEVISKPLAANSVPGFHPMTAFFWAFFACFPGFLLLSVALTSGQTSLGDTDAGQALAKYTGYFIGISAILAILFYMTKFKSRIVDDLVVNMIDVGEETGELDTMLYKVADTYDEEVRVMTDGLTKLMEPLMIVFLGVAVGFIVIALFMPLVQLISELSG